MQRDVQRVYNTCTTCRQAKSNILPCGLYTSLPILKEPWDISIDFNLGLPR